MAEIAVALDVDGRGPALELVEELSPEADLFKVGLELFTHEGPEIVRALKERGARVFLDLKLHDIPNTVAGAVEAAARQGVDYLTVHAAGGPRMLEAAAGAAAGGPRLLAVTVLTSLSAAELETVWDRPLRSIRDEVVRLAEMATGAGIDGIVSSVEEAVSLRRRLGPDVVLATPGIRLAGDARHDQARVATPAEAVRAGSSLLVVGRTVTGADDPPSALRGVRREVRGAGDEPTDGEGR